MSQYPIIQVPNNPPAQKVFTVPPGTRIRLRLLNSVAGDNGGVGTIVRYASTRDLLDIPSPFLPLSGHRLLQGDGNVERKWTGELWVEGVPGNSIVGQLDASHEDHLPLPGEAKPFGG